MRIVLASVLKSCEDVRLYHKIGKSLQQNLPTAQVEVWGQGNLFRFKRLGWARIWANLMFFLALWRTNPKVVVVATFELLPAGVLYKLLRGGKLGYDVQENYAYNVLYTQVFPRFLRAFLAFIIRAIERIALPAVDFVWVAEECYLEEMPFLRKKATLLPNKVLQSSVRQVLEQARTNASPMKESLVFLYSGNVSRDYGILEVVQWIGEFRQVLPTAVLHIIGHCPREADRQALEKMASEQDFIQLEINDSPIAHERILEAMLHADWLVMPYQINKSVAGRIPTKFYEGLALGKRMLITSHTVWQQFMARFPEAVVVWQGRQDINMLAEAIGEEQKILPVPIIEGVFWEEVSLFKGF